MPLIIPQLDDRNYRQILNEVIARIPVHNPEWNNFGDSDTGITLLQLFSFMQENLLFRANLIPERNRLRFLQLLGLPLRPATPARGVVTIQNERGGNEAVTLPAGLPMFAGKIGFATENALDVLPVESKTYIRRRLTDEERLDAERTYAQLYDSFTDDETEPEYYETRLIEPPASGSAWPSVDLTVDTVDGSLWMLLLAREADKNRVNAVRDEIAGKTLTLGLMPVLEERSRTLRPGGKRSEDQAPFLYQVSTGQIQGGLPRYERLEVRADDNPLEKLTLVQATLPAASLIGHWSDLDPLEDGVGDFPPSLEDDAVKQRAIAWIRIRIQEPATTGASVGALARFSWSGINAARVTQRIQVSGEPLGTGNGEPDQMFRLANRNVIPESVVLVVGGERWALTDDLLAAPPEAPVAGVTGQGSAAAGDPRVARLDAEAGELFGGTGLAGKRFPKGAPLVMSYSYGGGVEGNIGLGAIKGGPQLPQGFKALNPLPTWGGAVAQTPDEAERAIPSYLAHRDRAVTRDDTREIVQQTPGVAMGRVDVLPLFHPDTGSPSPGVVTVMVIPFDPARAEGPVPDRLFLDAVCRYLEPRRVLTTEMHVIGPEYSGLSISIGIDIAANRDIAPVREAVKAVIRAFLSPLFGGPEGAGWPLETAVEDRELFAVATRVDGVSQVRQVRMWNAAGQEITTLPITGLLLPRLDGLSVTAGDAEDLRALPPSTTPKRRLPVPVLPVGC